MSGEDKKLWLEFTKYVTRIKNDNIANQYVNSCQVSVEKLNVCRPKKRIDINLQDYPRNTSVLLMSKLEKRKFVEEISLDLHRLTKNEAMQILPVFCKRCILLGIRNIVVITGKGSGIIRQATLDWLVSSSSHVISFFPITSSLKEIGAYAVRLRKI
jgi:DNA-nicking Smr family endonuclease